jgi:quinol monooxygenase YgiN
MATAGVVHIPFYATGFRGDDLEAALAELAPTTLRHGARSYQVYRYHDDRYKFLFCAEFSSKEEFEQWWFGPEATDFRVITSSWYQVPVVYGWTDLVTSGALDPEPMHTATGLPHTTGDLAG